MHPPAGPLPAVAASPAVVAALAAASPCHRGRVVQPPVVRVRQSSEPKPTVRASPPSARSPSPVVATTVVAVVGRCRRRRRGRHRCLRRSHRRRRHRRQHSRSRVALPLWSFAWGRRLRHHLRPRALSVMFAAIGRRLSSSGRHRRPPPVAAVVVVDPRLYIFTSILTRRRAQPPCRRHRRPGPGMLHVRRRRVAVVVLAAALWSWSSSSGRGCARRRRLAVFRCWRKPGHRTRQNMRATPALPILHLDSAVSIKTTPPQPWSPPHGGPGSHRRS